MSGLILDIIIILVFALILLFSVWRGFYKMIFGLVSALLAIIIAVLLTSTVTTLIIDKTNLDSYLSSGIDKVLSSVPNGEVELQFVDLDGDGEANEVGYYVDGANEPVAFVKLIEGEWYSLFGKIMEGVVSKQLSPGETVPFRTALQLAVTAYVMTAIVFIVLLIIFAILVKLLMILLRKFVTQSYLGHFVNKLLGGVLGAGIGMVIIWGFLAVIKFMATYEWVIPVNTLIEDSTVSKLLFDNNLLYNFLVKSFDVTGILDSIFENLGAVGGSNGTGGESEAAANAAVAFFARKV